MLTKGAFMSSVNSWGHITEKGSGNNLMGEEISLNTIWVFIGIFPANRLRIDRNEWWKAITDREILNEIFS
jgi:hypothetical protein